MSNQPDRGWLDKRAAEGMLKLVNEALASGVGKLPPVRGFLGAIDYIRTREPVEDWLTMLDVGCGVGMYSQIVDLFCPRIDYVGCDFSLHMVKLARERFPKSAFFVANARHPIQGWYDIILASSFVEVCGTEWRKVLANLLGSEVTWVILNRIRVRNDPSQSTQVREYVTLYNTTSWDVVHNWPELEALAQEHGGTFVFAKAYQVEPETSLMCYVVEVA